MPLWNEIASFLKEIKQFCKRQIKALSWAIFPAQYQIYDLNRFWTIQVIPNVVHMPKTYITCRFGQYNLPQFDLQFVVEDMIWFVWNSVHVMTRYGIICCANFMYTVIKFQKIQRFIKQHRFYSLFWSSHRLHHLQAALT